MGNYLPNFTQHQVKKDPDNGNEAHQATNDCLRNPLIVRLILEHFSRQELLQLSVVNKLWRCEAQSVLRIRGQLIAYVKSHEFHQFDSIDQVDAFLSDLKQINPSGIGIDIDFKPGNAKWRWTNPQYPIVAQDQLQGAILDLPSLKTLSVKLRGPWLFYMTSTGFQLAKKLLQDCSGVLEELEFYIDSDRERFIEKVVEHITFPRLKILKLRETSSPPHEVAYENYMKALVSRAPKLQVLHSNWSTNLLLSVLEGTSVQPVLGFADAPFENITEDVISAIRLERIKLVYAGPDFNFERYNQITPTLLRDSCTTALREMHVDAVLAVSLMCFGVPLENVQKLCMDIDYGRLERIEPRISRVLKNFNFSRIFPKLNKVKIVAFSSYPRCSPMHINGIIEQANAVLGESVPDRAVKVKTLDLDQRSLSSEAVQFFAEMFPNIEKLETDSFGSARIPFGSLWNWLDLKELKVRGNMLPTAGNLDSIFCGIFPEEVAQLRLMDEEYLKGVHIIPVMPAITCLRDLRSLSLYHWDYRYLPLGNDATFLFSKVTALVAFAKQPALAVSLKISARSVPPATDHLKPYVSVSSHLRGN